MDGKKCTHMVRFVESITELMGFKDGDWFLALKEEETWFVRLSHFRRVTVDDVFIKESQVLTYPIEMPKDIILKLKLAQDAYRDHTESVDAVVEWLESVGVSCDGTEIEELIAEATTTGDESSISELMSCIENIMVSDGEGNHEKN